MFRTAKAAVKLHTLLDLRGNIPTFIHIGDGKVRADNIPTTCRVPALLHRGCGYLDFERLYRFHEAGSFFVTCGKAKLRSNAALACARSHDGVDCDQRVSYWILLAPRLRGTATPHPLQGPRNRQDPHLSDQQLRLAAIYDG